MANPQKENGYTAIANEILEAVFRVELTGSARNILFIIFRKTYGFNKKSDDISITQFCELSKLSRRGVEYAIRELEEKKLILIKRNYKGKEKTTNTYQFNKNYDGWVAQGFALGSAPDGKEVAHHSAHTKETITKEIYITKEIKETTMTWRNTESEETENVIQLDEDENTPSQRELTVWNDEASREWGKKLKSKGMYGQILVEYIKAKNMNFETKASADYQVYLFKKYAVKISEQYQDIERVKRALAKMNEKYDPSMWTLKTVLDKLPTIV